MKIMRKKMLVMFSILVTLLIITPTAGRPSWDHNPTAFTHGSSYLVEDEIYYFKGPGSEPGVTDVPGHTWVQSGPTTFQGRHYNLGPNGAASWWAPTEANKVLLFVVEGILDVWSAEISLEMASQGFIHYHEIVDSDGEEHPSIVLWLKHIAVSSFLFAPAPMPGAAHYVTPGVDLHFMQNYFKPYNP